MNAYIVAQSFPPTIYCPPWCDEEKEFHLAELGPWEGYVLHRGRFDQSMPDTRSSVSIGRLLTVDGVPDDDHRESACGLVINGADYTITAAVALAAAITAAVAVAREEMARV